MRQINSQNVGEYFSNVCMCMRKRIKKGSLAVSQSQNQAVGLIIIHSYYLTFNFSSARNKYTPPPDFFCRSISRTNIKYYITLSNLYTGNVIQIPPENSASCIQ